jgi:hypothetical protein
MQCESALEAAETIIELAYRLRHRLSDEVGLVRRESCLDRECLSTQPCVKQFTLSARLGASMFVVVGS